MEFLAHPKTARWFRDIIITEKIDGTNAGVIIQAQGSNTYPSEGALALVWNDEDQQCYSIGAQSRKRLLSLDSDNFGFARWVADNAVGLVLALGDGRHMGEWWGSGIQRGYGLTNGEKRFSLFNTSKWKPSHDVDVPERFKDVPGLGVVPVLYQGPNDQVEIAAAAGYLQRAGSLAAPGFDRPEGVCIFHVASNKIFKYTPFENNDGHKG